MKYVIAGKSESFRNYTKFYDYIEGKDVIYAKTSKLFNQITEEDVIVLLPGWWAKRWAEKAVERAKKRHVPFIYLDGEFGAEHRKSLKSDNIKSRFEILDL